MVEPKALSDQVDGPVQQVAQFTSSNDIAGYFSRRLELPRPALHLSDARLECITFNSQFSVGVSQDTLAAPGAFERANNATLGKIYQYHHQARKGKQHTQVIKIYLGCKRNRNSPIPFSAEYAQRAQHAQ